MKFAKPVIRQFFIEDEGLNKIISHHFEKRIVLFLQLKAEGTRKRKLGVITISTKTFQVKRHRENHLYNNGVAWGFNENVLSSGKSFDKIWLIDDWRSKGEPTIRTEWVIPVQFILNPENGFYLHHKQQGFELQKIIKLEEIEQFKVLPEQKRRF